MQNPRTAHPSGYNTGFRRIATVSKGIGDCREQPSNCLQWAKKRVKILHCFFQPHVGAKDGPHL